MSTPLLILCAHIGTYHGRYVCGRSVGIGAYLVRLNQRTIQRRAAAPIILTGYAALNKLVGRSVYTSNAQLGGPGIMCVRCVVHPPAFCWCLSAWLLLCATNTMIDDADMMTIN